MKYLCVLLLASLAWGQELCVDGSWQYQTNPPMGIPCPTSLINARAHRTGNEGQGFDCRFDAPDATDWRAVLHDMGSGPANFTYTPLQIGIFPADPSLPCPSALYRTRGNIVECVGEPMDVPAIQETREEEYGHSSWCNSCSDGACTAMGCDPHATHKVTIDTCADKARILLTDEQGGKHCLKFTN